MNSGLLSAIEQMWGLFVQDLPFWLLAGYICGYLVLIPQFGFVGSLLWPIIMARPPDTF